MPSDFFLISVWLAVLVHTVQLSSCRELCNKPARCIRIRLCPNVFSSITESAFSTERIRRLQKLTCGFDGDDPKVCCSSDEVISPSQDDSIKFQSTFSQFPKLEDCGSSSVKVSDYIIGGRVPAIGAFPFLARLGFKASGESEVSYFCGGAIISKRYLLTAAHCIMGVRYEPGFDSPFEVQLGEHDTRVDPEYAPELDTYSSVKNYFVAKYISHSDYDPMTKKNDIALLRLAEDITFTDFIKPICLPFIEKYNLTGFPNLGPENYESTGPVQADIAGWGKIANDNFGGSSILQFVQVPILSNQECQQIYSGKTTIAPTQLCAGGKAGSDSCDGDSGGPLMVYHENTNKYFLGALVSFGPTVCGSVGYPGIYTRVGSEYFLSWILENIE